MKTVLVGMLLMCGVVRAEAVVISEIMYNPEGTNSGRYWIEVFNDAGNTVNLTTWKFFEDNVNHSITESQGGAPLPAGAYAVIADNPTKFKTDYPDYQGILYDSSFSLLTAGESLSLKESSSASLAFTIDYTPHVSLGGDNDGSTLSLVSGSWVRGRATPGAENVAEEGSANNTSSSSSSGSDTQITIAQATPPSPDIILYMPRETLAIAGAETTLKVSGLTRAGKEIKGLQFTWAFGDGGRGTGSTTKHTYVYSGRYIAQVYGSNEYIAGTGRMTVRVVPPDISIIGAGRGKYGTYVDVRNPNTYDLDVSGWAIWIDGAVYLFPQNTVIAANSTTRFAGASMGFANTAVHQGTVFKIQFPNLEEVARFIPASFEQVAGVSTSSASVMRTATSSGKRIEHAAVSSPKKLAATDRESTAPTATSSAASSKKDQKDKRIATWLRSLFNR